MTKKIKKGKTWYWEDVNGQLVPRDYIPQDERDADKLVGKIVGKVQKFQEKMTEFKKEVRAEIADYLKELAAKYGEEARGNPTIYNFNKTQQIEMKLANRFVFNEKLQIAKSKIDKLITEWSKDSRKELIAIINKAFSVDKKGKLDNKRLFDLMSLKINDPDWIEAMDMLKESMVIDSTKSYEYFRIKDENGRWKTISLNYSAI